MSVRPLNWEKKPVSEESEILHIWYKNLQPCSDGYIIAYIL